MTPYRCDFFDHGNNVFDSETFWAEHDEDAKEQASRLFHASIGKGYQICQGDRHVHTHHYRGKFHPKPPSDRST